MKITKQSFGYVLETGKSVTVFDAAITDKCKTPDISLYSNGSGATYIPNQHVKEFKQKFIEAGGVIE